MNADELQIKRGDEQVARAGRRSSSPGSYRTAPYTLFGFDPEPVKLRAGETAMTEPPWNSTHGCGDVA